MKVKKGFFAYIFIFLAIILVAVVICAAILVLSPKAQIFGIDYASEKSEVVIEQFASGKGYSKEYLKDHLVCSNGKAYTEEEYLELPEPRPNVATSELANVHYSKIVVKSNALNVTVRRIAGTGARDKVGFERSVNYTGFFSVKKNPNAFVETCEIIDDVLVYTYLVPDGLIFSCSGEIIVNYPKNSQKPIEVETTTGTVDFGGVTVQNSDITMAEFVGHDVKIKTTKGNVVLREMFTTNQQNLDIETTTGSITIQSVLSSSNTDVSLKTVSGQINFAKRKDETPLTTTVKSLKIESKNSIVYLGNISCVVEFLGEGGKLYANNLEGGLDCKETVTHTSFDIKEIGGQFLLSKGAYNDVIIGKADAFINIVNQKGVVEISNATEAVWVNTLTGSVKLKNCSDFLNIKTTKASVELIDCTARIKIETVSGKVFGTIKDVVGTGENVSTITSTSGDVALQIDQEEVFVLQTKGDSGVDVKLAGKEYTNNELVENKINGNTATHTLAVTTGGSITISNYNLTPAE